jgi:hypothetical protein
MEKFTTVRTELNPTAIMINLSLVDIIAVNVVKSGMAEYRFVSR